MKTPWPEHFEYDGARSLCHQHEERLLSFVHTWKEAVGNELALPTTKDPSYESLDKLLAHVLGAAASYMTWCCEVLELADPGMPDLPAADKLAKDPLHWAEEILNRWREPLAGIGIKRFYVGEHQSRWRTKYCIDAMLEHAVMHPTRHEYQLNHLMKRR